MMKGRLVLAAKAFAVVALGVGSGFVSGAIAFLENGERGRVSWGPFGHVAELVGWGVGLIVASVATFVTLAYSRMRDREAAREKPPTYASREV